jgi:hypothetical protein
VPAFQIRDAAAGEARSISRQAGNRACEIRAGAGKTAGQLDSAA